MKNWYELKPEDFPPGEPVLKMKRGLWYRDNNSGYSEDFSTAGLYDREEALQYCFDDNGKNGYCDVIAVPIRLAIQRDGFTQESFRRRIKNLQAIMQFAEDKPCQVAVF